MEKDLIKFMDHVEVLSKDYSKYEDLDKGIMFILNTPYLLTKVDYLELDNRQYEAELFQQKIEKLDYSKKTTKRPVPKSEITKRDADKMTLVDKEVEVYEVWSVSNGVGVFKSFTNKEDAIIYCRENNNKILEYLK